MSSTGQDNCRLISRFGKSVRSDKKVKGGSVLNEKQVRKKLLSLGKAGDILIGNMPLVKDSETKHLLVTGCTGSGKTNLIHNILPQIEQKKQSAIVIDQTGEMIAKYYNPDRGDIIFNPFDERNKAWDFWNDCEADDELERFAKILFSFNRKKTESKSDIFWEQAAETIFISSVQHLKASNQATLQNLQNLTNNVSLAILRNKLKGTPAERLLADANSATANSILAVLSTNTKPMSYLKDKSDHGSFSLKDYFQGIENNSGAWLFLATKPSNRELTLPIISCLAELALSMLMEIGIDRKRRVWFVVDELSALGKLPALNTLMAEGRKYGACVLAATQSLNQIYSNYGHYDGSTIFGQFGTSFFFSNKEPAIGKMISAMCGTEVITKQQKNTSFGANEFRDGQSYTEHEKSKLLVEYSDLTKLSVGECYVLMPEPDVRLSKIQAPESMLSDKNKRFIPSTKKEQNSDKQKHEGLTETKKDDITEDSNNPIINNDILSKPEDDVQIKTKPDPSLEFAKDI